MLLRTIKCNTTHCTLHASVSAVVAVQGMLLLPCMLLYKSHSCDLCFVCLQNVSFCSTKGQYTTLCQRGCLQVGQPEVIRLLAEWDADMEETDSIRRGRPLMHAANNGHTAAVKALVECGADPEATDDNGYTALMVAVFSDRCVVAVETGATSAFAREEL